MRQRVLFVCPRNSGPSRMAAAFLDHLAGDRYEALSAGPDPAEHPHPEVVDAMAELDVVVADGSGTLLTEELAGSATLIIAMGCAVKDGCPALTVAVEDWGLPDPGGKRMDEVRIIRDTARRLVERLIARLDTDAVVH